MLPKLIKKREAEEQLTIREVENQSPNKIEKTKFRKSNYIPSASRRDGLKKRLQEAIRTVKEKSESKKEWEETAK